MAHPPKGWFLAELARRFKMIYGIPNRALPDIISKNLTAFAKSLNKRHIRDSGDSKNFLSRRYLHFSLELTSESNIQKKM